MPFFMQLSQSVTDYFTSANTWVTIGGKILTIVLILIAAKIAIAVGRRAVQHVIHNRYSHRLRSSTRRHRTIEILLNNILSYTIYFIVTMVVMEQLGIPVKALLASAGVLGLAIGFGAQGLVRDIITGFFIIFEDQFAVGDTIRVADFTGTVEEIGLRTTKVKSWTGELLIIPNGEVAHVSNYSLHPSTAVVDVSIAYEEDVEEACQVLQEVLSEVAPEIEEIIHAPEVLGVQQLGASDVVIRVVAECRPMSQYGVERRLRKVIKRKLNEKGIEIPYPKLVAYQVPQVSNNGER